MSIINLTPSQLRQAAQFKEQIAKLQAELYKLAGTPAVKTAVAKASPAPKKKSGMSAAGRARIVAAQKTRWAKIKAAKGKVSAPATKVAKPAKKKFVMSAAAKAKISAAAKGRSSRPRNNR